MDGQARSLLTRSCGHVLSCVRPIRSGYDVVRILMALVLLIAAGLKCHQLATEPVIAHSILDSRWLLMATVEFELLFGFWLLANILPRLSRFAALGCFSAFTCVSLYKALSGYATCGCFGTVPVNPWYTSTLDLAFVVSLVICRPLHLPLLCSSGTEGEDRSRSALLSSAVFRRVSTVFLIWMSIGLPAAYAMGGYTDTTLSEAGEIIGDGNIVVLEPETWIGNRFPLLPYIKPFSDVTSPGDIPLRERLAEGEWTVVLYRHGCPKCRELLEHYGQSFQQEAIRVMPHSVSSVAVIEISSVASRSAMPHWCDIGKLADGYSWFVKTPIVLRLHNGIVQSSERYTSEVEVESLDTYFGDSSA